MRAQQVFIKPNHTAFSLGLRDSVNISTTDATQWGKTSTKKEPVLILFSAIFKQVKFFYKKQICAFDVSTNANA